MIDYQPEIFATIRSETSADLAELNVRLLARTAKAFNVPIVLSTVGVEAGINGRRSRRSSPSFPAFR
jgi:nicotinamidase-related amidase